MPVKIKTNEGQEPNTRAITLDELNEGKQRFLDHYQSCHGPYEGDTFSIQWETLNEAVDEFTDSNSIDPDTVAVRFLHSFHSGNQLTAEPGLLYMHMQLLTMEPTTITDFGRPVFRLVHEPTAWYVLKPDHLEMVEDPTLIEPMYMHNFEYREDEESENFIVLSDAPPEKFVKSITFPWKTEIWAMYHENGEPGDARINFSSVSFTGLDKGDTGVTWPHGLCMYLTDSEGHDMLNNDDTMVLFYYKGADMGTVCPPKCGSYIVAPEEILPAVTNLNTRFNKQ